MSKHTKNFKTVEQLKPGKGAGGEVVA